MKQKQKELDIKSWVKTETHCLAQHVGWGDGDLQTHLGWGDASLDVLGELSLETLLIVLLQVGHVVSHVFAQDVVAVNFCVVVLALGVVAREATGAVEGRKQCQALLNSQPVAQTKFSNSDH